MLKDNHKLYEQLKSDYPFFIYEGFTLKDSAEKLHVTYHFNLADKYSFYPELEFFKNDLSVIKLSDDVLQNFVFHIGLVELISYWKAACPPQIIIKPYFLSQEQVDWWKYLWFNGLGEFFYTNNIQVNLLDFVEVSAVGKNVPIPGLIQTENTKVLVPVGGGKDSAVTLELLKTHYNCMPFAVNPRGAILETIQAAGFSAENIIRVKRSIDPELLRLNDRGFLNGHTPFSALIAFVSAFIAALFGIRSIALSNESSANEPTDIISGVNHQYSKSFEFESDFRYYLNQYITPDINYFSFLRPLTEYSIAGLFANMPVYFPVFKSCNAGSKTDTWCGKCSKCLFTFIILSPHLSKKKVIEIFGKDLLEDMSLTEYFKELTGISETKPFECVGTVDEVNYALIRTIEKRGEVLPELLKYYISTPFFHRYKDFRKEDITQVEKNDHFLEDKFLLVLKKALHVK